MTPEPWRYQVIADQGARTLTIDAVFSVGSGDELAVDDGADPFVDGLVVSGLDGGDRGDGGEGDALVRDARGAWHAPSCARGCRLRYRFRLADAAEALDDVELSAIRGGAIVTAPSAWLVRPTSAPNGTRFRFHVVTPSGLTFVTGLPSIAPSTFEADTTSIGSAPFSAFGALRVRTLELEGGRLDVAIAPSGLPVDDATIAGWVTTSARAITGYYRRFPVARALLLVIPDGRDDDDGSVGFGQASGGGGASILARLGPSTTARALDDDWVLPHEMVHLAMPYMARRYHWFEEGLSTYVEPIARARVGELARERVWRGFLDGMPKGLPREGDRGLDRTPTWGRTYWGGALFCLLADVGIREQTKNARSLDDGLRAIIAAGASIADRWELERALQAIDAATGTKVITALHDAMGNAPVDVDLAALFHRLGVARKDDAIVFDDAAELASVRRAIDGSDRQ